jgi:hypothetical protein
VGQKRILVEITIVHRLSEDKHDRLVNTGLPSLEIDLEEFQTRPATCALLPQGESAVDFSSEAR